MMSVRKANVRDATAIAHVHVQTWQTTYAGIVPAEYLASLNEVERVPVWREWLSREIQVVVAEMEGEVVGFASAGPIREPLQDYDAKSGTGIVESFMSAMSLDKITWGGSRYALWGLVLALSFRSPS